MHVEKIRIENFKGLDLVDETLGGKSVYVTGANEAGKTSFISAIFCALTNKNLPPEPIKQGRKTGKIEVELDGGFMVVVDFKRKAGKKIESKLSLFNTETGEQITEAPRSRLNSLIGTLAFDPFEFMRLQPKPQLDYFCKAFGVEVGTIDGEYQELNDIIRLDKKKLNALKENLLPFDDKLANSEPPDASAIANEYAAAVEHNGKIESFFEKLEALVDEISDAEDDVKTLEEELKKAKEKVVELREKQKAGKAWYEKQEMHDAEAIKARLDGITEEAEAITEAKTQKANHEEAQKLEDSIETCGTEKVALMEKKRKLITKKTKDIAGFDYDEEKGFTLDGLPFHVDQNNTAAQIIAGLKLGTGLLGDVKIAKFDGSLLDNKHLAEVNEYAEKHGLQLFVELVERDQEELKIEFTEDTKDNAKPKK